MGPLPPLPFPLSLCTHAPSTSPPPSVQASWQYDTISLSFPLPLPSLPCGLDKKPRQKVTYRKGQYGRDAGRPQDKEEAVHRGRLSLRACAAESRRKKRKSEKKSALPQPTSPHAFVDHSCLLSVLTPTVSSLGHQQKPECLHATEKPPVIPTDFIICI